MPSNEHNVEENDISYVRFGGFATAGSETWITGSKMKPYQIKKLEELLKSMKSGGVKPEKEPAENLESMFD